MGAQGVFRTFIRKWTDRFKLKQPRNRSASRPYCVTPPCGMVTGRQVLRALSKRCCVTSRWRCSRQPDIHGATICTGIFLARPCSRCPHWIGASTTERIKRPLMNLCAAPDAVTKRPGLLSRVSCRQTSYPLPVSRMVSQIRHKIDAG